MLSLPRIGEVVLVTRERGDEHHGYLGYKADTLFRDDRDLYWLGMDGKFLSVLFNLVVSWRRIDGTN